MTRREAQEILLSCHPGAEPSDDPQVLAAMEMARTDPELRQWYEQLRGWDVAMRREFGALPVPADLKASILAGENVVVPGPAHWWNRRATIMAAAAMIALLIGLAVMFVKPPPAAADSFAQLRDEIVRKVLRNYDMDLETNDVRQVKAYLASQGAPADYVAPAGLQKLALAGCGVLSSQGRPVSMVCYEDARTRLVWMFVAKAANWPDRPGAQPAFERVATCETASWSEGELVYVIATENGLGELRKLF